MAEEFDRDYWDRVWLPADGPDGGHHGDAHHDRAAAMATADPNPHLVATLAQATPGTALDAGCGAGAEAIWLAEQGWAVTGADLAETALRHAASRADAAGVGERIRWVNTDLSTWEPNTTYDLVSTHYAHPNIGQLQFYDRLASWVAPGGSLFIVGHLDHGHAHGHHGPEAGPPPAARVRAADIAARFDPGDWEILRSDEVERAVPGHGTLADVVIHARRRA